MQEQGVLQSSKNLKIVINCVYNQGLESVIKCYCIILTRNGSLEMRGKCTLTIAKKAIY